MTVVKVILWILFLSLFIPFGIGFLNGLGVS